MSQLPGTWWFETRCYKLQLWRVGSANRRRCASPSATTSLEACCVACSRMRGPRPRRLRKPPTRRDGSGLTWHARRRHRHPRHGTGDCTGSDANKNGACLARGASHSVCRAGRVASVPTTIPPRRRRASRPQPSLTHHQTHSPSHFDGPLKQFRMLISRSRSRFCSPSHPTDASWCLAQTPFARRRSRRQRPRFNAVEPLATSFALRSALTSYFCCTTPSRRTDRRRALRAAPGRHSEQTMAPKTKRTPRLPSGSDVHRTRRGWFA